MTERDVIDYALAKLDQIGSNRHPGYIELAFDAIRQIDTMIERMKIASHQEPAYADVRSTARRAPAIVA